MGDCRGLPFDCRGLYRLSFSVGHLTALRIACPERSRKGSESTPSKSCWIPHQVRNDNGVVRNDNGFVRNDNGFFRIGDSFCIHLSKGGRLHLVRLGAGRTEDEKEEARSNVFVFVFVTTFLSFSFSFLFLFLVGLVFELCSNAVEPVFLLAALASPALRWRCANLFALRSSLLTRLCLIMPLRSWNFFAILSQNFSKFLQLHIFNLHDSRPPENNFISPSVVLPKNA